MHNNTKDLAAKLEQSKKDLNEELESLQKNNGLEEFGTEPDEAIEADEAEEFGNQMAIVQALKERLDDIDHALSKIAKGAYGTCETCGASIEHEILEIAPESRLCKTHKQA